MRDDAAGRQPSQAGSDGHDVVRPLESTVEVQARSQDADSPDVISELGMKVFRIRKLKGELAKNMSQGTERRALQERDRERCMGLEREAQENRARAADLSAEAQRLQEQLLSVKRKAAKHESEAKRLDVEADEKKEECVQREMTVAEGEKRCSDLDRELSALKAALDIDWTSS
ncbi:hypothetical protein B0A48_18590 [Cryoendolithus antarcticus]|uniref:Uncharacterized protein n=1 Tax=Cryoendolithus antarcticus TaxID=1507870 RepID=A0A1V8S833_9PEZI|nr:hypothetical protein B0A48_18590 [Cryoendolithus antarcticus]